MTPLLALKMGHPLKDSVRLEITRCTIQGSSAADKKKCGSVYATVNVAMRCLLMLALNTSVCSVKMFTMSLWSHQTQLSVTRLSHCT